MDKFRLIVHLLDQLDDFLVPIRRRLKPHLSEDRSRDSIFPDKSKNQNILLHMDWFRNGYSCVICQFEILELFRCPLIDKRRRVMRDILESRVSEDVLQSAMSKYV